jgi:hypothetical protein
MLWVRNQQKEIAELAGVSPQRLNDILHRRARCTQLMDAKILEGACNKILGKGKIKFTDFMDSYNTESPYFYGDPVKGEKDGKE